MNFFTLDGVSSEKYGVILSGDGAYGAPARSVETVSVPGRNGDLIFDNGRYENITISYEAGIANAAGYDEFRAWLLSHMDYCRLEDTYHPNEYRMAVPTGGIAPSMEASLRLAKFTVSFNAKPQRFLKSGEMAATLTASGRIYNHTFYPAKPLIRVYGYGTLGVGDDTITIASHSLEYIDIDCDIEDSYCGASNANGYITLSGDNYPALPPGRTGITMTGKISKVVITPRWWTL